MSLREHFYEYNPKLTGPGDIRIVFRVKLSKMKCHRFAKYAIGMWRAEDVQEADDILRGSHDLAQETGLRGNVKPKGLFEFRLELHSRASRRSQVQD
jgi:hypothetical protein